MEECITPVALHAPHHTASYEWWLCLWVIAEDFLGGGGFLQAGSFLTQAQQQQGPQISLVPIKVGRHYWLLCLRCFLDGSSAYCVMRAGGICVG